MWSLLKCACYVMCYSSAQLLCVQLIPIGRQGFGASYRAYSNPVDNSVLWRMVCLQQLTARVWGLEKCRQRFDIKDAVNVAVGKPPASSHAFSSTWPCVCASQVFSTMQRGVRERTLTMHSAFCGLHSVHSSTWPCVCASQVTRQQGFGQCREGFESNAQGLEEEHIQVSGQVDRTKISIEAKQRAEDDIRRDVEIAKLGAENALVERVRAKLFQHKRDRALLCMFSTRSYAQVGHQHTVCISASGLPLLTTIHCTGQCSGRLI